MQCNHTMWRIPLDERIASSLFPKQRGYKNGAFVFPKSDTVRFEYFVTMISRSHPRAQQVLDSIQEIPCGKCMQCRINNSREWAQRAVAESTCHAENYFITLTYDDDHIPAARWTYSRNDFNFKFLSPLRYEDFQDFKKRLLRYFDYHYQHEGIRFLACGEYGPSTDRPHYHAIFYNLPIPDLQVIRAVNVGGKSYSYLHSQIIEDLWGKGFITIGQVNWDTCAYVSRYVLKKLNGKDEEAYQKLCRENQKESLPSEFREASRRPGLGRPFYEENKDQIYKNDKVILPNGDTPKPCSYFDRLYDLEDPELLAQLKAERRRVAGIRQANRYAGMTPQQVANAKLSEELASNRKLSRLKRTI